MSNDFKVGATIGGIIVGAILVILDMVAFHPVSRLHFNCTQEIRQLVPGEGEIRDCNQYTRTN